MSSKLNYVLKFPALILTILALGYRCGPDEPIKKEVKLEENSHFAPAVFLKLEKSIRSDSAVCDNNYDLYFDFSATMARAVKDQKIKELVTAAFDKVEEGDKIYSIGENQQLKEISGDEATKTNQVLGPKNYTQKMTYMTPNMNNIQSNLSRPVLMFTDFSVDEGRPTTDMDGITSSFVRGPEFASQFKAWFLSGGSIKIYGKMLAESGSPMPVYVIAFLPKGFNEQHRMNRILTQLEQNLSKEIYFDFHTRYGTIEAVPSDEVKDARKSPPAVAKSYSKLEDGKLGEFMKLEGNKLMEISGNKESRDLLGISFISGLKFVPDSTSFITISGLKGECQKVSPETDKALSKEVEAYNPFFKDLVYDRQTGIINMPFDYMNAKVPNKYNNDQLLRYRIYVTGFEKGIRIDSDFASKTLQYNLKSGKKTIMNNCLYKSLEQAMNETADSLRASDSDYSIFFFIRKKK